MISSMSWGDAVSWPTTIPLAKVRISSIGEICSWLLLLAAAARLFSESWPLDEIMLLSYPLSTLFCDTRLPALRGRLAVAGFVTSKFVAVKDENFNGCNCRRLKAAAKKFSSDIYFDRKIFVILCLNLGAACWHRAWFELRRTLADFEVQTRAASGHAGNRNLEGSRRANQRTNGDAEKLFHNIHFVPKKI